MKKLTLSLLAGLIAVSAVGTAFADDNATSNMGPFTKDNPTFARIATAPFRVISGTGGFVIGAGAGLFKGIVDGAKEAASWTGDVHDKNKTGDTSEQVARNVLFVPTFVLGSVVLIPKNVVEDSLTTGWHLGGKACEVWDRL